MPSETAPIRVVAKVRPFAADEEGKGHRKITKASGDKIVVEAAGKEQSYSFDFAYGAETKASQLYQEHCDGLVQRALNGYNATFIAFGATGSGKTYLLSGIEDDPGIIPCVNKHLFQYMEANMGKKEYFVTISFIEVLDEQLTDLLNPHNEEMRIREHPQLGIYVDGLSDIVVYSLDDLAKYYEQGNRARKMGASDVRAHRNRSHGVFTVTIEQREHNSSKVGVKSKIVFADLAGIEAADNKDQTSKSVHTIVDVFSALKKGGHVPYRESKITRLLQESLGGNSMTMMFAVFSPSDKVYQGTMATVQNAQLAKGVKNHVRMNLDETNSIIGDLREEIARLRNKIAKATDPNKDDVVKLEELIHDLQVTKRQTWDEKERRSQRYLEERKTNLANRGILEWVMDTVKKGNKEVQERILLLQKEKDQLTLSYKDKRKLVDDMKDDLQHRIADYSKLAESGRASDSETKQRVTAIHDLKEKLKRESENLKDIKRRLKDVQDKQKNEKEGARDHAVLKGNAELRRMVELEERKRQENENRTMIAEELERMKIETEHEKAEIQMRAAEGKQYSSQEGSKLEMELTDLRSERSIVTMQIQCLQQEKERLNKDLDEAYKRQKEELEIQQLQHFQTFRQYREMFEEQKNVLEQRYRQLLQDSIQDAVFLSTRNSELVQENASLQRQTAELKDKLTVSGRR